MATLCKTTIPEGTQGDWQISRFTISEKDAKFFNMHATFRGYGSRSVQPGTFTKLTRNGHTVMSDTRAELRDHAIPVYEAKGQVLINGLGLGIVVEACLRKPEVEHVTVIEISADVIALVKPHLENDRLTIIHADALTWKPPKMVYDMVWHDIWSDICTDNWKTMTKLHRRYGRRSKWQGSWCRWEIQQMRRREAYC